MNDFIPKLPNLANMFDADLRSMEAQVISTNALLQSVSKQRAEREEELAGRNDAKEIFEYLISRLREFQTSLNEDEEIGLQIANFGKAAELHIRSIGFKNPNLIEFQGVDSQGNEAALIQHISQLSFMLIAVKPFKETPYRIGFL